MFSDNATEEIKRLAEYKEKQQRYDDLMSKLLPLINEFNLKLFNAELLPTLAQLKYLEVRIKFDEKGLVNDKVWGIETKDNQ